MEQRNNSEELTDAIIKFVIVAILFLIGFYINSFTNNV